MSTSSKGDVEPTQPDYRSYSYREGQPNSQPHGPHPHRQQSLAHRQEHASHSVDGSSTCEWNILLELARQTRGAGGDGGWIVPNSTSRPTQRRRTGRAQARMCVKHHERSQTTPHDLSNLPKATTKSSHQLHQHSTREKWVGLLEPRPPPGAVFPWLKPGQGVAKATCTNAPRETTLQRITPTVTKDV